MKRLTALWLVLLALAASPRAIRAAETPPARAGGERLAVALFTAGFLAEVAARIETERTESERLAGGYLQEKTGLIWTRQDSGADLDWHAAGKFCGELEVADWADWRLPTIEELEGLHDRRSVAEYKLTPAIKLTGCCPWSQTRNGDSSAWNFSFRYRKRFSGSLNYSYELRALCVRPADAADLLFFERVAEELKANS